ncbi:MAG: hypothetical protein N2Z74_00990, partial [Syntrophales bacterium]|nr:hypothetical protein [Syntrophales bacterium]
MITPTPSIGGAAPVRQLTTDLPTRLDLFVKGQVLEATVLKCGGGGNVLLQIGGNTIPAQSTITLTEGETLSLRVTETTPATILQIITDDYAEMEKTNGHLLFHRSRPQGVAEMFTALQAELANGVTKGTYPPELDRLVAELGTLLESLVFSSSSLQNPQFVNNYVQGLGLLFEHSLFRRLEERGKVWEAGPREGLKGTLLRFLQNLEMVMAKLPPGEREMLAALRQLQQQAQRAVQTIESQQVINVVSR